MSATPPEVIDRAEEQGREAARLGCGLSANPHGMAQGSSSRVVGIAWRRGWREVREQQERDEQDGQHFRTPRQETTP